MINFMKTGDAYGKMIYLIGIFVMLMIFAIVVFLIIKKFKTF